MLGVSVFSERGCSGTEENPMWRDRVLFIESIRRLLEFRAPGNLFLRKAFSSREGNLWN